MTLLLNISRYSRRKKITSSETGHEHLTSGIYESEAAMSGRNTSVDIMPKQHKSVNRSRNRRSGSGKTEQKKSKVRVLK